ncbi:MAG: maltose alpha-D-glucosyltransferase [Phycisphaeraceae bacterium]|nr:maltose alpha-D-glucosyltransferase [Phycisphaeraceae bacterium]
MPATRRRGSTARTAPAGSPNGTGSTGEQDPLWYKNAIIYELHVRSFCDSTGDGIGDFNGLISKLDYLQDLGVTAVWLLPFYPSPLKDDGYDIADYMNVNPSYGTFRDVERFIKEAHRRGLRVITELVVNHTSDAHPWFQRARRAPKGSAHRDYYVWSDTPDRYVGTRIIFKDFETSNWAWDPVAKQYYWHRFYSHQPDLNFENPAVLAEVLKVLDHWMSAGVDGMRLDAIPYLFERDGTNCENLPETHEVLRKIRSHVDKTWPGRMLLAEANQWPEDAIAYFGQGDECHMAFHFPLMPRLFMALRMEDRFPIIDILEQTPEIPKSCQWAVFLRNHDELTLEMVTDEERDYMYRVYAADRDARINLGIRRRLAPLLANNRRKIELMNALLFSLPGTPMLYYGDEIGMGDNVYLGDRDGVRTPMQWSADRNAGFSRCGPQRLFLPIIIDPEYHYETVNVESQLANPSSLLWWTKRLIALRKRHPVFGNGDIEFMSPTNPKVLAFVRSGSDETAMVVANLSRFAQPTHIDLSKFAGLTPVEIFGQTPFPAIDDKPYFLTLGPHSFYWFLFKPNEAFAVTSDGTDARLLPVVDCPRDPAAWLPTREGWPTLGRLLSGDVPHRRWFASKAKTFRALHVTDCVPFKHAAGSAGAWMLLCQVDYADHEPETYAIPIVMYPKDDTASPLADRPAGVIATVADPSGTQWVLADAMSTPDMPALLLDCIARGRSHPGTRGELIATKTRAFGPTGDVKSLPVKISRAEQSNSSAMFGDRFVLKLFRRIEAGVNPDLEVLRHLTERARFGNTPSLTGSIEYRTGSDDPRTLAILQEFVENQGDAWSYALDQVGLFYERALALGDSQITQIRSLLPESPLDSFTDALTKECADLLGDFAVAAALLGRRTLELHVALATDHGNPEFTPEPYSALYQRSLSQSMRNTVRRTLQMLRKKMDRIPADARSSVDELVGREADAVAFFQSASTIPVSTLRIRCHGDYHLGQVLWTGKDFVIIDFEGEPNRSLGERRLKRSPLRDVASMMRSFQYASETGLRRHHDRGGNGAPAMHRLADLWQVAATSAYVGAYVSMARKTAPSLIPESDDAVRTLLRIWLFEKSLSEINYELNSRPDWVGIPLAAALSLLSGGH